MENSLSDSELKRLRVLAESLRGERGSVTVNWAADLSDSKLEILLKATQESRRSSAVKRMWDVEKWLSAR